MRARDALAPGCGASEGLTTAGVRSSCPGGGGVAVLRSWRATALSDQNARDVSCIPKLRAAAIGCLDRLAARPSFADTPIMYDCLAHLRHPNFEFDFLNFNPNCDLAAPQLQTIRMLERRADATDT